ncbi:MAG: hypothetical protein E7214_08280 [Clostridium sp.]|nr:hypothetical protein [Clostridium sp.]
MKIVYILILLIMVSVNVFCFIKSKKYFKMVNGDDEVSQENYKKGLKYVKISVVISLLICLGGSLMILLQQLIK